MRSSRHELLVVLAVAAFAACGGAQKTPEPGAGENAGLGEFAASHGGLGPLHGTPTTTTAVIPDGLRLDPIEPERPVKLDGVLSEWPPLAPLKQAIKGAGSAKGAMSAAVQYDDTKLYVGGDVTNERLVRTERFSDVEDHASLILAFPGAGAAGYEIGFFAGKPGESAGSVRYLSGARRGHEVGGSKIVEAKSANGYTFEASLPWTAFAEASTVRVGLRGAARYYQADAPGSIALIVATGTGDASSPASLPSLPMKAEMALTERLLEANHLAPTPTLDAFVDVAGDAMKERISVFGHFLTILGSRYFNGTTFFYRDLGAGVELAKLEFRPVTGRGKADLVLRLRSASQGVTREWVEVLSVLGASEEPKTMFAHEVSITSGAKHLENTLRLGDKVIEVTYEPAAGWDASSFHEAPDPEVEALVTPWGAVRSQLFQFDGSQFKKTKEVAQAAHAGAPPRPTEPARTTEPTRPPRPTTRAAEIVARIIDQYKIDRGLPPDTKPRFELEVNVGGDARPEKVVLMGREIVIYGPGYKGGRAYAFIALTQFQDASDIKDVSVRDVTGDGVADILVRGILRAKAEGSPDPVEREVLFIYQVDSQSLSRIFSIETAREHAGKRAESNVQFVSSGRIEVQPGRVTGWTERSYPWQQERPGSGQVEPLLLPWGGLATVRYAWSGGQFTLR